MKRPSAASWALALLVLVSLASAVQAQAPSAAERPAGHLGPMHYDVSKETTLSGTVSSVLKKPNEGMVLGSHLLLQTPSGPVDASLGRFAFMGRNALQVTAGQQVRVTGVMTTIRNNQVFLVRTVQSEGRVFALRNYQGTPNGPPARIVPTSAVSYPKGGKL
jgi:hypothetical protein